MSGCGCRCRTPRPGRRRRGTSPASSRRGARARPTCGRGRRRRRGASRAGGGSTPATRSSRTDRRRTARASPGCRCRPPPRAEPSMNRHMSSTDVVPPRHRLGVRHVRRGPGDLRSERAVRRVDVVLQPLPQRHRLGGAAQQAGVQVGVVQAGDHGVHRRVDACADVAAAGCRATSSDRPDGGDLAVDDEHRAWIVNGPRAVHRHDDAVVDEDAGRCAGHGQRSREPLDEAPDLVEVAGAAVVVDPGDDERVLGQRDDLGAGQPGLLGEGEVVVGHVAAEVGGVVGVHRDPHARRAAGRRSPWPSCRW